MCQKPPSQPSKGSILAGRCPSCPMPQKDRRTKTSHIMGVQDAVAIASTVHPQKPLHSGTGPNPFGIWELLMHLAAI